MSFGKFILSMDPNRDDMAALLQQKLSGIQPGDEQVCGK